MLPLTREYALAELRKNQEFKKEALNRWLEWYKKFAKKHHEPEKKPERFVAGYNRLHEEWENLLAVLRWCKDEERYEDVKELWSYLNNYANLRGHWQDRRFWLGWIIKASTLRGEHKTTLGAKSRKGRTLLLMGKPDDLENAEKLLLEAWELRQYGDFDDLDYLTNHLAGLYLRLEKPEEAHKWLNLEQEILNDTNLPNGKRIGHQIYIDRERAEVLFEQGRYSQAKALCNQVIQESDKIKNQRHKNYSVVINSRLGTPAPSLPEANNIGGVTFDKTLNLA
jgi:LuxR family glucitol operon transcriptional activator